MLSLRAERTAQISDIGYGIYAIWKHIEQLKKGILSDLNIDTKHRKSGNLTALVGYASNLFTIIDSQKRRPRSFGDLNFNSPNRDGGGNITDGSNMKYSSKITDNHLLSDHLVFQFIADAEFYTNRAVIEVWKIIRKLEKTTGKPLFRITSLYSGFQRPDRRNWLGFHDGVSNLKSRERPYVIFINSRNLNPVDIWTLNGTYLAFMRIILDIGKWEDTEVHEQEKLVGREKVTGCPIIGIDRNGNPVKDPRCPVPGTREVVDAGNEKFREPTAYGNFPRDKILLHSHVSLSRPKDNLPIWDNKSSRIYRQGFEFLAQSESNEGFVPGLNFVSFQNTPDRFFRSLTYQQRLLQKDTTDVVPTFNDYMKVLAAGIFFVPPKILNSPFPGAQIFFKDRELRKLCLTL